MKRLLLMTIVAAFSACLYAQNGPSFSVSGTVFDKETKETIPGARIVLSKNKKAVANTDYDGRFRLDSVKAGTIIEISFVGYKTKVVKISEKDRSRKLDIYLDQDNAILQVHKHLTRTAVHLFARCRSGVIHQRAQDDTLRT